ncbi:hypothetical protein [Methylobacterium sp. V23]|uniref:hypothetical protein n=1 Tax=Methylobacterium sp. V23 TaxID=2044878 RepID=UPI000CDA9A2E|nr:hypothetical protein [Methylobacterium sp. V23]POR42666.1 hypothetical protein CRT23_12880 [Methylobacterium sp. V23]
MATTFADLTTSWQQIATAATTLQASSGVVMLQVSATAPANTETRGHILDTTNLPGVTWGAQTAGEKLYARALQGTASVIMTADIA